MHPLHCFHYFLSKNCNYAITSHLLHLLSPSLCPSCHQSFPSYPPSVRTIKTIQKEPPSAERYIAVSLFILLLCYPHFVGIFSCGRSRTPLTL